MLKYLSIHASIWKNPSRRFKDTDDILDSTWIRISSELTIKSERINIHTVRNDPLLGTLKFVSKTRDYQIYGALIPDEMINQDIKDSKAIRLCCLCFGIDTTKKARIGVSDDDSNNDDSDDVSNDDDEDDDVDSDDDEEEYEEEHVCTPKNYKFTDDEEYEELYKDVNVRLKDVEHEDKEKGDAEMTDVGRGNGSQENSYEKDEEDAYVTLTTAHITQKTKGPMQSSSVSSDFASQFLNLDNVLPTDSEVVSMMNVKVSHEEPSTQTPSFLTIPVTVIPETSIVVAPTIPPTIPPITPLPQLSIPTPIPTPTTITSIPALPDFSSCIGYQPKSFYLGKRALSTQTSGLLCTIARNDKVTNSCNKFEKNAKDERKRYIDLVEKSVKDIIKDKIKTQLPQILPKEVFEFATPVIQSSLLIT
ncbi:hypothetical protein Tco_0404936 [Tanacetum coccineum]